MSKAMVFTSSLFQQFHLKIACVSKILGSEQQVGFCCSFLGFFSLGFFWWEECRGEGVLEGLSILTLDSFSSDPAHPSESTAAAAAGVIIKVEHGVRMSFSTLTP